MRRSPTPSPAPTRALFGKDALIGEGSHFYKIDGKYYITSAWYAGRMRMPAARADRIEGPWELNRSISADEAFGLAPGSAPARQRQLAGRSSSTRGNPTARGGMAMHQGGIVQTPPASGGAGRCSRQFRRAPHGTVAGHVEGRMAVLRLAGKPRPHAAHLGQAEDGTAERRHAPYVRDDEFSGPELANVWQWNHVPDDTKWSLKERPGFLRLHSLPASDFWWARNSLTQRAVGPQSTPTTVLETAA